MVAGSSLATVGSYFEPMKWRCHELGCDIAFPIPWRDNMDKNSCFL